MSTKSLPHFMHGFLTTLCVLSLSHGARGQTTQTVACCFPSGGCQDLPAAQCVAFGGAPGPAGSTCANTSCTAPQACCLQSGGCQLLAPSECAQIGGYPGGMGSTCQNNLCTERPCCLPDGTCVFVAPQYCQAQGGLVGPLGAPCPNECPQPGECRPKDDGSACQDTVCPDGVDKCRPQKVLLTATGPKVLECGCDTCYVDLQTGAAPTCSGTCPPGQVCRQITTQTPSGVVIECTCEDDPTLCEPTADRLRCTDTVCPTDTDKCRPKCVVWNPPTHSYQIQDCDCRNPDECHVDLTGLANGVPPHCTGACPPDTICNEKRTQNADGSYTICCECEPVSQDCAPNRELTDCNPTACPIAGQQCVKQVIRRLPTGGFQVIGCDCQDPDKCHIELPPVGAVDPICVNECPDPSLICQLRATPGPNNSIDYTCVCLCDPARCDDGNPCTDDFCDPAANQCVHLPNAQCEACCLPDGTCQTIPPTICQQQGGAPKGPGSDCTTVECPPTVPKFRQPPSQGQDDLASNVDLNDLQPNIVHADDFQSDGRPIVLVRWWGSYLNPEYMPAQFGGFGQPPFMIDGWFISFHEPIRVNSPTLVQPPLGLYFAPASAVRIVPTTIPACDNHRVFQYEVRIDECCLICANPDSRSGSVPAQCDAFREEHCFMYDIDIQAVVGRRYVKGTGGCPCLAQSTPNIANGHFWGWHSTTFERGARQAIRAPFNLTGANCPFYGPWNYAQHLCTNLKRPNMAFELHTNTPTIPPPCPRACCQPDGTCIDVLSPAQCNGTLQPIGTTCATAVCPQPQCQPRADGSACEDVLCPDATDKCKPRLVLITTTGQVQVLECGCAGDECHVEVVAGAAPHCAGTCPPGQVCHSITTQTPNGTILECKCEDEPTLCEPTADRLRCTNATCPASGQKCQPHCINWNPPTNSYQVIDCECRDPALCHVDITGIPNGVPPHCVADCPPGFVCKETRTLNADGSYEICCDCVPDQQDCAPNPTGTACNPTACPIPGQQCIPKRIRGTAASGFVITECGCDDPDRCHLQWQPGTLPSCVGVCPDPTQTCFTRQIQTPLGIEFFCECECDPAKCNDGNPCTDDRCDPVTGQCVHIPNNLCEACCFEDGTCQQLPPTICISQGGTPKGPGTDCSTVECNPPVVPKFRQPPTQGQDDLASNVDANDLQPNIVHADDFQSDGRPIVLVRWWGSYLNPEYMPAQFGGFGQPPYMIDGWFISFHTPIRVTSTGVPQQPLGLYFAPANAVRITPTTIAPCDQHQVFQYDVRIDECCLICANPDPRSGNVPARCEAFAEEHCFLYDIDIQAVVGRRFVKGIGGCPCIAQSTQNFATGNFWGWHSTTLERGARQAVRAPLSLTGVNCPLYGPWSFAQHVCTFLKRPSMAFELHTDVPTIPPPCPRACCLPDGTCMDVTAASQCHGTLQPVGSTCATTICPKPPIVVQWRSVRTNATLGPLAIVLDPTAVGNGSTGPTTEPRQGGIQRIEVDFDQPVILVNPAAVATEGQTTTYPGGVLLGPVAYAPSAVFMVSATTMAIEYPAAAPGNLPDRTCYNFDVAGTVQNAAGQGLIGDTDCNARSLLGDATSNGVVNLSDPLYIKSKFGQPAGSFPQCDINLTGANINIFDALMSKGRVATPPRRALCP